MKLSASQFAPWLAIVIGISVGVLIFIDFWNGSTHTKLVRASQYMNRHLPMNVDNSTRWDTTVPGPGKRMTYYCTLVNVSKSEISVDEITAKAKAKFLLNYRTSPVMKMLRENRITLRVVYRDKLGEPVIMVEVSPDNLRPN